VCQRIVLLERAKVILSSQTCECNRFRVFFWGGAAMVKLQQFFTSEPDGVHRRSSDAMQQRTSLVETSKLVIGKI